jgi:hypothetical protein
MKEELEINVDNKYQGTRPNSHADKYEEADEQEEYEDENDDFNMDMLDGTN